MIPKVSIIIPCYNDVQYISRAVKSALGQTYSNTEIIVIDDGSDEETKRILKKIEPSIDKLITQENTGVVMARNRAIHDAKGEYILTLDSDDFFEPSFLEKGVAILDQKEKVGMVTCWVAIRDDQWEKIKVAKPSGSDASRGIFYNSATGSILFRKLCWVEVDGYDENLWMGNEDWEFNIAITKNGWRIEVIPEVLFNYQQKKKSRNSTAKGYQKQIREYTFKKHQDLLVQNIENSIDYFLEEIDLRERQIAKLKNSKDYEVGKSFLAPFRKIKELLHR